MCYTQSPVFMRSQKKLDDLVATCTDDEDQTGDSGMGTGSGTNSDGTIEEWKRAIQNPPGMCKLCL